MKNFLISMAFSVLFELLKEKNVPEEYRAALAKLALQVMSRAKSDPKLAQLVQPKANS
jgi:hypothetical protein